MLKVSIEGKQLYRGSNGRSETQTYYGINKLRQLRGKITTTKTWKRGESDTPNAHKEKNV